MSAVSLSTSELEQFRTSGFVVRRAMLAPVEIDALAAELEAALDARYPTFDGTERQWALVSTHATPRFLALLEDPRFATIAAQVLDGREIGVACDASRFVGDTLWHGDVVSSVQRGVKMIFYFEPLDATNGALRVVPSSHEQPLYDRVRAALRSDTEDPSHPSIALEVEPGDVIVYDIRLQHASFGGRPGRRGASVFYYGEPTTLAERVALEQQDLLSRGHVRDFHRRGGASHELPAMSPLVDAARANDAHASERMQRWNRALRDLGFFAPAAVALDPRDRVPHRARSPNK